MEIQHDDGDRTIIHMPSGERYYLLAFPHAQELQFDVKFPFENRPENEREKQSIGEILAVVNQHVAAIHDYYQGIIDELGDQLKEVGE